MSKTPIQLMNLQGMGQETLRVKEVAEYHLQPSFGTIAKLINDDGKHFEFYIDLSEATIAKLKEAINNEPEDPTGYLLRQEGHPPAERTDRPANIGPRELIHLQEELLAVLSKLQEERPRRKDWVEFESQSMLYAVNCRRILRGKEDVSRADFLQAERSATGHSDYSSKFALYCAELVLKP